MNTDTARIRSTHLGFEDHGILSAYLNLEGEGWGQSFGGYDLRPDGEAAKWISGLLRTFEVDKWEALAGLYSRIERDGGKISAVGHIVKDKWFRP